jgi:hypothetical protein
MSKAIIHPGLGSNLAYESIAYFANALVPLLREHSNLSQGELTELFTHFVQIRRPRAVTVNKLCGQVTRCKAQDTWFLKFASRHISPLVGDKVKAEAYAGFSNGAP